VLGLSGGAADETTTRLAIGMARGRGGELVAVHVVEVDWSHGLTEDLSSTSDLPQRVLDGAEAAAEDAGVPMATVLLQAREAGPALVDEALQRDADLIIIGLPFRRRLGGDFDQGRTVPYVLANAPSAVWVVREPPREAASP
jgi:nucleotide-binding universal stress UspA family protein